MELAAAPLALFLGEVRKLSLMICSHSGRFEDTAKRGTRANRPHARRKPQTRKHHAGRRQSNRASPPDKPSPDTLAIAAAKQACRRADNQHVNQTALTVVA